MMSRYLHHRHKQVPPLPPKPNGSPNFSGAPNLATRKISPPISNLLASKGREQYDSGVKIDGTPPTKLPLKNNLMTGGHGICTNQNDFGTKMIPPSCPRRVDMYEDSFSDDFSSSDEENAYEHPIGEQFKCNDRGSRPKEDSRKESEIPTPPLLPAPRQPSQSSTSSSLSSLRSSTGDFREWDKRKYPSTSVTRTTPLSDAEVQPWFFNISRQDAEIYLHDCADGTFLMRPSTKGGSDSVATLNVQFNGKVFHVLVQKRNGGKFGLGTSKEGEETFASIVELVEYYQRKRLQLFSNGNLAGTTSLRSCYQSPW